MHPCTTGAVRVSSRVLGEGGFGKVYHGHSKGRPVAVKYVPAKVRVRNDHDQAEVDAGEMPVVMGEIRMLERLSKTQQCRDHVSCLVSAEKTPQGGLCIVIDYIDGKELYKYKPEVEWSRDDWLHAARQLVRGLKFIHDHGMAHVDVKPENVMVDVSDPDNPRYKYIDFGFACTEDTCANAQWHGTPDLKPPEAYVRRGEGYRYTLEDLQQADLWSLGAMLLELAASPGKQYTTLADMGLSGRTQFDGEPIDSKQVLDKQGSAIDLREPAYYKVITGLMRKNPDDRMSLSDTLHKLDADQKAGGKRARIWDPVLCHEMTEATQCPGLGKNSKCVWEDDRCRYKIGKREAARIDQMSAMYDASPAFTELLERAVQNVGLGPTEFWFTRVALPSAERPGVTRQSVEQQMEDVANADPTRVRDIIRSIIWKIKELNKTRPNRLADADWGNVRDLDDLDALEVDLKEQDRVKVLTMAVNLLEKAALAQEGWEPTDSEFGDDSSAEVAEQPKPSSWWPFSRARAQPALSTAEQPKPASWWPFSRP